MNAFMSNEKIDENEGPSAETVEARRQMFNTKLGPLYFQHISSIFHTRKVTRGGPISTLPAAHLDKLPDVKLHDSVVTARSVLDHTDTNAFLVVRNGRIVWEEYRNHSTPDTQFMSFSVAKSLTSILFGLAVDRGLIHSVDDQITQYVPELKNSAYDGVSIRQALQMRAGTDYEESFEDRPGTALDMLTQSAFTERMRMSEYAFSAKRKYEPGSHFAYATVDTAVLSWVLERAIKQPIATFTSAYLWEPLGMERDASWALDGPNGVGREGSAWGFNATLRDYARIGLLMLNNGRSNGVQVLSEAWVKESTSVLPIVGLPGAAGYGYHWWRLTDCESFCATGYGGQMLYVHRPSNTVIVKTSNTPIEEFYSKIVDIGLFFEAIANSEF